MAVSFDHGGQSLIANVVTLSAFRALIAYVMSMLALLRLRRVMPNLERPLLTRSARAPEKERTPATATL